MSKKAQTRESLAAALGISRATLQRLARLPGAPKNNDLAKWRRFRDQQPGARQSAALIPGIGAEIYRNKKLDADIKERKLGRISEEHFSISEIHTQFGKIVLDLEAAMTTALPLSCALKMKELFGLTQPQMYQAMLALRDNIFYVFREAQRKGVQFGLLEAFETANAISDDEIETLVDQWYSRKKNQPPGPAPDDLPSGAPIFQPGTSPPLNIGPFKLSPEVFAIHLKAWRKANPDAPLAPGEEGYQDNPPPAPSSTPPPPETSP